MKRMHATIWQILLLSLHLLHAKCDDAEAFAPALSANASAWQHLEFMAPDGEQLKTMEEDTVIVEASTPPTWQRRSSLTSSAASSSEPFSTTSTPSLSSKRRSRQLFFDPNLFFLQQFSFPAAPQPEGGRCHGALGVGGVCVRHAACPRLVSYYGRQLSFVTHSVNQWPPQQAPSSAAGDLCSYYDQFGRALSGICCTEPLSLEGVLPLPAPPAEAARPPAEVATTRPPAPDLEADVDGDLDADVGLGGSDALSPDFPDETNVVYDPVKDGSAPNYEDYYRYQWPSTAHYHPGVIGQQWPPPLPTHPPSSASWPPPLPTHPPNHHYPTHPSAGGGATTTTTTTTTRRPTTRTTTRRPATTPRPAYPAYPSYPTYPSYRPTYRPPQAPPTTAKTTTTTTRRPATTGGLPSQCGVKNPISPDQERIVGGSNASPHEFPWIAVLFRSGKQFCGGSLITHSHILTAAHCVARMTSWDVAAMTAHLGDYNIRTDFEVQHVKRRIKRLVRHKGFDFSHLHNDIAILTVDEPVPFTYEIQPICLPTASAQQSRSYSGQLATVAGWGSLRENGPQPSILQKVQIPIWTNTECARKYGRSAPGGITEAMICAGQTAKDSCSGDSGGPLIVSDSGRYTQVGIVSWGIGCGKGEYPGVYTRITSLLPWIYKNIK